MRLGRWRGGRYCMKRVWAIESRIERWWGGLELASGWLRRRPPHSHLGLGPQVIDNVYNLRHAVRKHQRPHDHREDTEEPLVVVLGADVAVTYRGEGHDGPVAGQVVRIDMLSVEVARRIGGLASVLCCGGGGGGVG